MRPPPPDPHEPAPDNAGQTTGVLLRIGLLVLGFALGAGGAVGYFMAMPRPPSEMSTVMSRFILPVPVGTCKQIMILGFRVAGFQTITPDPGDGVGVGAPGQQIAGAALCMPALGAATVSMSGTDHALLLKQMQAFSSAVAATTAASPSQPPRR